MMETMTDDLLYLEGVGKQFPTKKGLMTAVEPTSFGVRQTELVSIVGPSGCGKSTLLHMVGGLVPPSSGRILLDGAEVLDAGADRGMVFQGYTLFPWLTVKKNVQFGPRLKRQKPSERDRVCEYFLDAVGLTGFRDHYPKQLSGGMRQRVAIARALANNPRILLMDEPFGALDAQTRLVMQELLLQIRRKERTTTLFITHDIDEAVFLSDRIFVMTARPGRFKAEIPVPFGQDRSLDITRAPEFFALRTQIFELLHAEGKAVVDAEMAAGAKVH